jgi:hypothetical protein
MGKGRGVYGQKAACPCFCSLPAVVYGSLVARPDRGRNQVGFSQARRYANHQQRSRAHPNPFSAEHYDGGEDLEKDAQHDASRPLEGRFPEEF